MRSLPLHPLHAAAGARFGARAGAETVLSFGEPRGEVDALRRTVGLADRSYRALLTVIGPEARLYLHGMTTNEVKALRPGQGNQAALIDARGKMLADAEVLCFAEEALVLVLPPECHEPARAHLDRYLVSEDCELGDATGGSAILGLYGPRAADVLAAAIGDPAPSLPLHHHEIRAIGGIPARVVAAAPEGVSGYEVWVGADEGPAVWQALERAARAAGGGPVGEDALEALRIHHAVPRYGAELDESTIPLEANLEPAISYTKGCYVGQEVIAKATYRGQLRRRLARFRVPPGTRPGAALIEGEKALGRLTSVLDPDPAGGPPLALGYLRRDRLALGARLPLEGGGDVEVDWVPAERES